MTNLLDSASGVGHCSISEPSAEKLKQILWLVKLSNCIQNLFKSLVFYGKFIFKKISLSLANQVLKLIFPFKVSSLDV